MGWGGYITRRVFKRGSGGRKMQSVSLGVRREIRISSVPGRDLGLVDRYVQKGGRYFVHCEPSTWKLGACIFVGSVELSRKVRRISLVEKVLLPEQRRDFVRTTASEQSEIADSQINGTDQRRPDEFPLPPRTSPGEAPVPLA